MGHEFAPILAIVYNLAEPLVVVCKITSFNLLTCFVKNIQIMQIAVITYPYAFQKLPLDLSQRFLPIWHVFGVILSFAYDLLIQLVIVGTSADCHVFTRFLKYMRFMVIHIMRNTCIIGFPTTDFGLFARFGAKSFLILISSFSCAS